MTWQQLSFDDVNDHGTLERYRGGCGCPDCITAARTPAQRPAKGVTWNKGRRCWSAMVQACGRKVYVGYYPSATEAARIVDAADVVLGRKPANGTNPAADDIAAARDVLAVRGLAAAA